MVTMPNQKCFIVEGNIGAGKTTFLKMVQEYLNVHLVYEPLDKWQNVGGSENLLQRFYEDTPRWAYTFQTYAFVTRILAQENAAKIAQFPIQILERSVYSDRYCFAKNCFELGKMTALEWKLYQEWFSWLVESYTVKPTGFIYLQTDPQVCHDRILKRSRSEDKGVPLEYLQKLHNKHEEWLVQKIGVMPYLKETPVLVLSCNKDFEHDIEEQESHIEKIVYFLNENQAGGGAYKDRISSATL